MISRRLALRPLALPGTLAAIACGLVVFAGGSSVRAGGAVLAQAGTGAASPQSRVRATAAQPLAIGDTFTIDSVVLGETRRINVYLPPGYADAKGASFPVLYMPDGGLAEDFLHVAGLIEVLTGDNSMRPFVLVGIENTQRRRDLTGPTSNADDKKIAPVVGGSAAFRTFIRTELIPLIDARYRTTRERAIIGESLAGLFVVETFMVEPDLFDAYAAFDPSLWWNNGGLVAAVQRGLPAWGTKPKALYLAASRDDISNFTAQFADILKAKAPATLRWHFEPMPEETHATIYHPAALRALRWLFPVSVAK